MFKAYQQAKGVSVLVERQEGCEEQAGVPKEQTKIPQELIERRPQLVAEVEQIVKDPDVLRECERLHKQVSQLSLKDLLQPYTPGDLLRSPDE